MAEEKDKPKDAAQEAERRIGSRILDQRALLIKVRKEIAALQTKMAGTNANTPAYKEYSTQLNALRKQESDAMAEIQKDENALIEVQSIQEGAGKAKSNLDRTKAEAELSEINANKEAGKGPYTNAQLEQIANASAGRKVAQQNADTATAAQGETARANQAREKFDRDRLDLENKLKNREISDAEYRTRLNEIFNNARTELDRIGEMNKAAATVYQGELTQRSQDLTNKADIRARVGSNISNCMQFVQQTMRHMPRGATITEDDILAFGRKCDEMAQARETARFDDPKQNVEKVEAPQGLKDTAEGKGPIQNVRGTSLFGPEQPATPEEPAATGAEAADRVFNKWNEWVAAGGDPNDWDSFVKHDEATGAPVQGAEGAAPAEAPGYVQEAIQQQPAAPAEQTAVQAPAAPPVAQPAQASPQWAMQSLLPSRAGAQQQQQPMQTPQAGSININVGAAPAAPAPVQPPAMPPVQQPDMDPDFNTAVDAMTGSILKEVGLFNPNLHSKFEIPPNQMGPFSSYVMDPMHDL